MRCTEALPPPGVIFSRGFNDNTLDSIVISMVVSPLVTASGMQAEHGAYYPSRELGSANQIPCQMPRSGAIIPNVLPGVLMMGIIL